MLSLVEWRWLGCMTGFLFDEGSQSYQCQSMPNYKKTFTNKIEHTCGCSLAFDVICPNYILFQPAIQRYIHPSTHIFYTSTLPRLSCRHPPRNRNASSLRTCHSSIVCDIQNNSCQYWPFGILAIFPQQTKKHMISTHQLLIPMTFTSTLGPFGSTSNPFFLPSQKFITDQVTPTR